MDQLPVSMFADQQMGLGSAVSQWHHQLLAMPEGDNDSLSLTVQLIHLLPAHRPEPQSSPQEAYHHGSERWNQVHLQPVHHVYAVITVLGEP
jgi:hypothetical protein